MNNFHPPFNCTSADLEKVALSRLRQLVKLLPAQCRIFREPWDNSTVVCLDFCQCPYFLNDLPSNEDEIIQGIQALGLANTVLFRMGRKLIGWKAIAPSQSP